MNNLNNFNIYIFDYEGTLSESPSKKLTLKELLYEFDFKNLLPNKNIYNFVNRIKYKEIYVVGIIETNKEIEQKSEWIKMYYPTIKKENCIFISNNYKKSEIIAEIINKNNYNKDEIIFIDDKVEHINDVSKLGIKCIIVDEI